ncbi:MAG: B12-binding domain-containing radical SAM protein [PVC group bacterium]|nr:B12-binding domain-containing radical SAM protein [PVC group bacterium]
MERKTALVLAPPFWPNLPPLSLTSLAGYLFSNNQEVDIFDLNNIFFNYADKKLQQAWKKSCNKWLEDSMPDMLETRFKKYLDENIIRLAEYENIGFSCYKSNIKTTIMLAQAVKQNNQSIKIAFGGPEITRLNFKTQGVFPREINDLADLIVIGEGEKSLLDFVQRKKQEKTVAFSEVDNLNHNGYSCAYNKINISSYPRKQTISMLLSRGCIRHCRFCSERLLYKRFRTRTIKDILGEIAFHKQNGVNVFVFHDSMLNADLKLLEEFCDGVINTFGSIGWEAQMGIRANMPDELLLKMKKSGCYNIFIGLESGAEQTLKRMNKGFELDMARKFFKQLKSAGLFFGVSLIVGFPGETEAESEESLKFLIDNKDIIPKIEQVNPFVYYDGTDTEEKYGYHNNQVVLERTADFIRRLREKGFKMTNAFLNNLVEKI